MTDWQLTTIGQHAHVKHRFAFKGEYFRDQPPGDILLTPGNFAIGGGIQLERLKYYKGPTIADYVLSGGDVLVTMTDLSKAGDTLGYPAKVPRDGRVYLHNQRLGKLISRNTGVGLDFLYWLMRWSVYRHEVLSSCTGSTVRHTSPARIEIFKFRLPSTNERIAICQALNVLDDKIELNRRMNETLEAMAQAIFRDWFVDFGPTRRKLAGTADPIEIMGGLVQDPARAAELAALFPDAIGDNGLPVGWETRRIGDILTLAYGKALTKTVRNQGKIPVYGSGGMNGTHDVALVQGPGLIVGRKGTVGSLYWEDCDFFPIDTVFFVEPNLTVSLNLNLCYTADS